MSHPKRRIVSRKSCDLPDDIEGVGLSKRQRLLTERNDMHDGGSVKHSSKHRRGSGSTKGSEQRRSMSSDHSSSRQSSSFSSRASMERTMDRNSEDMGSARVSDQVRCNRRRSASVVDDLVDEESAVSNQDDEECGDKDSLEEMSGDDSDDEDNAVVTKQVGTRAMDCRADLSHASKRMKHMREYDACDDVLCFLGMLV